MSSLMPLFLPLFMAAFACFAGWSVLEVIDEMGRSAKPARDAGSSASYRAVPRFDGKTFIRFAEERATSKNDLGNVMLSHAQWKDVGAVREELIGSGAFAEEDASREAVAALGFGKNAGKP